ncbi:MAG: thioesterase family protein [Pseudomonadota bacterium]
MTAGRGAIDFETAFVAPLTPRAEDFDMLGHVNNAVYVRWVQEMAVAHWETTAPPDMVAGSVFVVLRHEIDYRDPILPGDAVEGRTWLGRARGPRFERFVDVRKPGAAKPAAFARTDWCRLNTLTRRPMRIDAALLEAFDVPG